MLAKIKKADLPEALVAKKQAKAAYDAQDKLCREIYGDVMEVIFTNERKDLPERYEKAVQKLRELAQAFVLADMEVDRHLALREAQGWEDALTHHPCANIDHGKCEREKQACLERAAQMEVDILECISMAEAAGYATKDYVDNHPMLAPMALEEPKTNEPGGRR